MKGCQHSCFVFVTQMDALDTSGLISLRNLFEGFILLYWQCFGVEESASVRDNTLKHSEKNKS